MGTREGADSPGVDDLARGTVTAIRTLCVAQRSKKASFWSWVKSVKIPDVVLAGNKDT